MEKLRINKQGNYIFNPLILSSLNNPNNKTFSNEEKTALYEDIQNDINKAAIKTSNFFSNKKNVTIISYLNKLKESTSKRYVKYINKFINSIAPNSAVKYNIKAIKDKKNINDIFKYFSPVILIKINSLLENIFNFSYSSKNNKSNLAYTELIEIKKDLNIYLKTNNLSRKEQVMHQGGVRCKEDPLSIVLCFFVIILPGFCVILAGVLALGSVGLALYLIILICEHLLEILPYLSKNKNTSVNISGRPLNTKNKNILVNTSERPLNNNTPVNILGRPLNTKNKNTSVNISERPLNNNTPVNILGRPLNTKNKNT
jgi:hypothetical protein